MFELSIINYITKNINFFKNKEVMKMIENIDKELVSLLIKDTNCLDYFFIKIEETFIFNQRKFINFLSNNFNSLLNLDQVNLSYSNKDNILISDMCKEDDKYGTEFFYDKENDKDKISEIFKPKKFVNFRKYQNKNKTTNIPDIISEKNNNLLIKGNNLIGLYSLSKRYSGMVDMIYIDPPYYFNKNKSSDSFEYNSNFKLSTWLTFMKNRLDIAKEILSNNGVIFISMSEDGTSHLKVLCDEVFGKENFISNFVWRNTGQQQNNGKNVVTVTESIICYSKNNNGKNINRVSIEDRKGIKSYRYIETEGLNIGKRFRANPIQDHTLGKHKFSIIHKLTKQKIELTSRVKEEDLWNLDKQGLIYWGDGSKSTLPQKKKYLEDNKGVLVNNVIEGIFYEQSNKELYDLFGIKNLFSYSKPVSLIRFLVEIGSNKNSIIMDFFAGSGTTGHAVMEQNKLDGGNRKFILLEQMDYIENITEERLIKAINYNNFNENFIYCELLESENKKIKTNIKKCQNKEELFYFIDKISYNNKEELIELIKNSNLRDSIKILLNLLNSYSDYISLEKDNIDDLNLFFYDIIK